MQIVVKGKNMDVTEALRSHAEKRISKISRYFDRIISTDVTLSTERNWHIVEVTVHANGQVLRGEERTNDMYSSIDKVIDKLEQQVKKQKGKVSRKGRGRHLGETLAAEAANAMVAAHVAGRELEDPHSIEPHVEQVKRFESHPMSVEQAVKEIEEEDVPFYVFLNASNDRINVLYKLAKGYGLIDPIPA
jgi:putative sigma-54 modulation protein